MGADMKEENACGFEGFEKRLEVEFEGVGYIKGSHISSNAGLRALSRCELDEMLMAAECTIVSERHNPWFDAYVLSESSLFVYPHRLVLKTCGKTRLLNAVPVLLRQATTLSLKAVRCKYSRGTFIFPDAQPFPYTCFTEETRVLDKHFAHMIEHGCRSAHILGGHPVSNSSSWHIYTASAVKESASPTIAAGDHFKPLSVVAGEYFKVVTDTATAVGDFVMSPVLQRPSCVYTLEMCMTHLDTSTSSHFMNLSGTKSGADMTHMSGISSLLPNADICDYAFSPCGYSMNGMEEEALSTIHITPEQGHSYASFEVMGYDAHSMDLSALVNRVVACFKPGSLVMSVHAFGYGKSRLDSMSSSWDTSNVVPRGYVCNSSVKQELAGDGVVTFHTFTRGSSATRCGVIPQPLRSHIGQADEWVIETSCEPSDVDGNPDKDDDDDGITLPCIQENVSPSSLLQLEDATLEMVGEELQAERRCYPCDVYSGKGNNRIAFAHGVLKTHEAFLSAYRSIKYCGAMLTIVDSEMELFQLRKCYPHARVILRLKPSCQGSHAKLCSNAEELLRKTARLGLQVIGIGVDTSIESRTTECGYKAAIRAAIKVCGRARDLGMPPLKLLAMGPCAATSLSYE